MFSEKCMATIEEAKEKLRTKKLHEAKEWQEENLQNTVKELEKEFGECWSMAKIYFDEDTKCVMIKFPEHYPIRRVAVSMYQAPARWGHYYETITEALANSETCFSITCKQIRKLFRR